MRTLVIDVRMASFTGIGRYIRGVVPEILKTPSQNLIAQLTLRWRIRQFVSCPHVFTRDSADRPNFPLESGHPQFLDSRFSAQRDSGSASLLGGRGTKKQITFNR